VRVERGSDAWQTRLDEAASGRGSDQQGRATVEASAGDGPTWEPGTKRPVEGVAASLRDTDLR
jgi:hypothetical protein